MQDFFALVAHLFVTLVRILGPGEARSIVAESLLVKHQLLIVNRSRKRAPNLRAGDRLLMSMCALLMRPVRIAKSAIIVRPATILRFHQALKDRKYRRLFSPKSRARSDRAFRGSDCRNYCCETTKPPVGLPENCPTIINGL